MEKASTVFGLGDRFLELGPPSCPILSLPGVETYPFRFGDDPFEGCGNIVFDFVDERHEFPPDCFSPDRLAHLKDTAYRNLKDSKAFARWKVANNIDDERLEADDHLESTAVQAVSQDVRGKFDHVDLSRLPSRHLSGPDLSLRTCPTHCRASTVKQHRLDDNLSFADVADR